MKRQHASPYLIRNNQVHLLQRVMGTERTQFGEAWLQKFVFAHPASIPVNEIEAAFGPLIPVCRELPTKAGFVDLLFANSSGLLTIIECKLWKNPEARREVVGQILDYAKELSRWSYDELQTAINNSQDATELSLYELMCQHADIAGESEFIDNVSRNLRKGRFLLLVVGDGIRENVEQMVDFLQEYAHLNFGFALIEYSVFKLPNQDGEFFVQPRLVTQTIEIERAVVRIENNQIVASSLEMQKNNLMPHRKRGKISEQVFFENLKADSLTKSQLQTFFEKLQDLGLSIEPGQNSMKVKSDLGRINFCIFSTSGEFYNRGIGSSTQELGAPEIGENYLRDLAGLFDHGFANFESKSSFMWTVQIKHGNKHRYPDVSEAMSVQDKLIELIQKTIDQVSEILAD